MALRFVDSFSHMGTDTTLLPHKWTAIAGSVAFSTDATKTGSGYGLELISGFTAPGTVRKTLTHKSTWTIGVRVYTGYLGGEYDGLHNGTSLVTWIINVDGTISIKTNGVTIATSINSLHEFAKYYIELTYTLSGTSNIAVAATLHVNGVSWASGTANSGINQTSLLVGTSTVNGHEISAPSVNSIFISDLYICDGDGSFNNTFLGDITILRIMPNGDVVTNWTPSTGTTHYTLVNETSPDGDSTYVKDATATHQDIYDWEDIPSFTGTICGVQMSVYARKDAEGTKTFKQVVGDTGTEQSSDIYSPSDDYLYYSFCYDVDPATSLAWTRTGFNAKRFGINLVS